MKKNKIVVFFSIVMVVTGLFSSCRRYDEPPPNFEDYSADTVAMPGRKIIYVMVEGLSGVELNKAVIASAAPSISAMLTNSKYAFDSYNSDATATAPTALATSLYGFRSDVHKILDDTYQYQPSASDLNGGSIVYPVTFLKRLLQAKPQLQLTAASSSPVIYRSLLVNANNNVLTQSDAQSKDSAVSSIKNGDPDVVVVDFRSVMAAGIANDFSMDNAVYKQAVTTVDGYVGEIMAAMKTRKTFSSEEWMVVIQSNCGGTTGNQLKQTFSIFYSPKFVGEKFEAAQMFAAGIFGCGRGLQQYGFPMNGGGRATTNFTVGKGPDVDKYNIPAVAGAALTVEFRVKAGVNTSNLAEETCLIGTKVERGFSYLSNRGGGWGIFQNGPNVKFRANTKETANGSGNFESGSRGIGDIGDKAWHTVAVRFKYVGPGNGAGRNAYQVDCYFDGVKTESFSSNTMPGEIVWGSATNPVNPLSIGMGYDPAGDYYPYDNYKNKFQIADIRIWNKFLEDKTLADNINLPDPTVTKHPNSADLIAWWPCTEGQGTTLYNKAPNHTTGEDITLLGGQPGDVQFPYTSSVPGTMSKPGAFTVQDVDAIPNMAYWLGIKPNAAWGWVGTSWLKNYKEEFETL